MKRYNIHWLKLEEIEDPEGEFGVARMLGLPTLNETHHVQNNQIVKVEM